MIRRTRRRRSNRGGRPASARRRGCCRSTQRRSRQRLRRSGTTCCRKAYCTCSRRRSPNAFSAWLKYRLMMLDRDECVRTGRVRREVAAERRRVAQDEIGRAVHVTGQMQSPRRLHRQGATRRRVRDFHKTRRIDFHRDRWRSDHCCRRRGHGRRFRRDHGRFAHRRRHDCRRRRGYRRCRHANVVLADLLAGAVDVLVTRRQRDYAHPGVTDRPPLHSSLLEHPGT